MPSPLPKPDDIDGEALISHPVGENGKEFPADAVKMNRQGRAHQDVPQIDRKSGKNNGEGGRSCTQHGDRYELRASGKDDSGHDSDIKPIESRFLGQNAKGKP